MKTFIAVFAIILMVAASGQRATVAARAAGPVVHGVARFDGCVPRDCRIFCDPACLQCHSAPEGMQVTCPLGRRFKR